MTSQQHQPPPPQQFQLLLENEQLQQQQAQPPQVDMQHNNDKNSNVTTSQQRHRSYSLSTNNQPTTNNNNNNNNNNRRNSASYPEENDEFNQKLLLLCHFCERDGPSVLYCTQTIHHSLSFSHNSTNNNHTNNTNHNHNTNNDNNTNNNDATSNNTNIHHIHIPPPSSPPSPTSSTSSTLTDEYLEQQEHQNEQQQDEIHRILRLYQSNVLLHHIQHATLDHNQLFISAHRIKHAHTSKFKSLSLRSLSVEYVGPGREGPVLFGDETTGYGLAYVFKLKDSKARGFTRWYSFVLMDNGLSCLTLSWSFVQKAFCHVVKCLKKRSQEIFLIESQQQQQQQQQLQQQQQHFGSLGASQGVSSSVGTTTSAGEGSSMPPMMNNFYHHHRSIQKRTGPLRPLPVLLQHESLFVDLHVWQSSILRAFCDRMIHLDPSMYLHTTSFGAMPRVTSNNVHLVNQNGAAERTSSDDSVSGTAMKSPRSTNATTTLAMDCLNQWSIVVKRLIKDVEKQKAKAQIAQQIKNLKKQNLFISHSNETDVLNALMFDSRSEDRTGHNGDILSTYEASLEVNHSVHSNVHSHSQIMNTLTYCVLVGHQLIIRSNDINIANDICRLYVKLIPEKNASVAFNCSKVKKSYEANFVTVHSSVPIPGSDIDYHGSVLLDLTFMQDNHNRSHQKTKLQMLNLVYEGQVHETTLGMQIKQLYTKSFLRYKTPQSCSKDELDRQMMEKIRITEDSLINSLKLEYLSKAQIIIKAVRSMRSTNPQNEQSLINHMLQMLQLTSHDLPIVQNFAAGLGRTR